MLCIKPTDHIYKEMTSEQCYLSLQLFTKLPGGFDGTSIQEITYEINKWKARMEVGRTIQNSGHCKKGGMKSEKEEKKEERYCINISLS